MQFKLKFKEFKKPQSGDEDSKIEKEDTDKNSVKRPGLTTEELNELYKDDHLDQYRSYK